MPDNRENFTSWYVNVLESLYPNKDAGFAILMIAFPLLERYLRSTSCLSQNSGINCEFHTQLAKLFPELSECKTKENAQYFWPLFRHGILHQVTFNSHHKTKPLPRGGIDHEMNCAISCADNTFRINPKLFAMRVIDTITNDFSEFERYGKTGPQMPVVDPSGSTMANPGASYPSEFVCTPKGATS